MFLSLQVGEARKTQIMKAMWQSTNAISPLQSQGSAGTSTHESVGSNPYMQQPWGAYGPPQPFTNEHLMVRKIFDILFLVSVHLTFNGNCRKIRHCLCIGCISLVVIKETTGILITS